ncbi:ribonuclease hi [Plakobranchus ocellatus]|uniref:Ribonuclease hi n=1 Tax=Plakobranchus ocellatus TaxID=259542 RepID=A0AAV3ZFS6_9GAST|nr:ribonuclease hi [Plakobranchus ocellatus]
MGDITFSPPCFVFSPHVLSCAIVPSTSSFAVHCPKFLEDQAILRYKAEKSDTFQQVCIQGNENVDKLAKAALNKASHLGKLICRSGLKSKVNAYIHTVWQQNLDIERANKLQEVLPNLGEDISKRGEGKGRKRETVMCRLRVGHTWLTQGYL